MNDKNRTGVCLVTPEFPPSEWGGLARTAFRVAGHVRDMGLTIHVAHISTVDDPLVLLDENRSTGIVDEITVHRITTGREHFPPGQRTLWDCPHTLTLRMMYQSLEKLHMDLDFDLFHSFFLYPVGYVTGLLARRFHVPHLATIVGNDINKYMFSPEKAGLCLSALTNAHKVVGVSRDLMEMADALTPVRDKAGVIYNAVDLPERAWRTSGLKERFKLGVAGIFKYAKGMPYLLKAVAELRRTGPIDLELVGRVRDSERRILERMMDATGLDGAVRIRPAMDHDRVLEWLLGLDAFVLPSVSEGCPNILMEALACGLPCVATGVGAVPELMEDGVSGLVVPWGDADALSRALAGLRADPTRAARMGRAGRERMKRFSANREMAEWKKAYEGLMGFPLKAGS